MNYFGDPHNKLCTDRCPTLASPVVNATANINLPAGHLFADYSTRLCVYMCPLDYGISGTFGDNTTNTCVSRCPANSYGDANTINRYCVVQCTNAAFADDLTMTLPLFQYNFRCVYLCPIGYYANALGNCVIPASCDSNTYG